MARDLTWSVRRNARSEDRGWEGWESAISGVITGLTVATETVERES